MEDAKSEFKSHSELQGEIRFHDPFNTISFSVPSFWQVFLKVICVNNMDSCEKRPALVEKMFNALKQHLN